MNISSVSAELVTKLASLTGLRAYAFPPDALTPPTAIIGYPESIAFDGTFNRGMDRMTVPVYLVLDRNWDRATAQGFSDYTAGAGASSFKQLLETGPHTAFSTARVMSCSFSVISVAGVEYWAATFMVDITGPGGA